MSTTKSGEAAANFLLRFQLRKKSLWSSGGSQSICSIRSRESHTELGLIRTVYSKSLIARDKNKYIWAPVHLSVRPLYINAQYCRVKLTFQYQTWQPKNPRRVVGVAMWLLSYHLASLHQNPSVSSWIWKMTSLSCRWTQQKQEKKKNFYFFLHQPESLC